MSDMSDEEALGLFEDVGKLNEEKVKQDEDREES
jgi:hypothetical protein